MIERSEVEAVVRSVFPHRAVRQMERLKGGIDFVVHRVDFDRGDSVVFRGQRNHTDAYLGSLDFGRILAGEIRFYELLPALPLPRLLHFEPTETAFGFPYAFFTYLPGQPLSELLPQLTELQIRSIAHEMGRLLSRIHVVRVERIGRLWDSTPQTWGSYFSQRLRRRLEPYLGEGLIAQHELEILIEKAATLERRVPTLLHMDFRPANMLAEVASGDVRITGIVDAANTLAGDPAFELARLDEGIGLEPAFWVAYKNGDKAVDRESVSYLLYRLETASLLRNVLRNSEESGFRLQRFLYLKETLIQRLS